MKHEAPARAQLDGVVEQPAPALKTDTAPSGMQPAGAVRAPEWRTGMTATVLNGAVATGSPSADAVLTEHTPVEPGGHACRACGHVYSHDLPVCPAVLAARAGYPDVADRLRLVDVDGQVTALEAMQVGQERLEARVDALAGTVEGLGKATEDSERVPWGASVIAASVWTAITFVVWRWAHHADLGGGWSYLGAIALLTVLAGEVLSCWLDVAEPVVEIVGQRRQRRREAKAAGRR